MLFDFAILLYIFCFITVGLYAFLSHKRLIIFSHFFAIVGIMLNLAFIVQKWLTLPNNLAGDLSHVFALIIFFLSAASVLMSIKYKKITLYFFIMPIVIIIGLVALYHHSIGVMKEYHAGFWLFVHLPFTIAGTTLFIISAVFGILYFIQEKQLKKKNFGFLYNLLPSIDLLNKLNMNTMLIGFALFTAGLISGFIWGIYEWGGRIMLTPKLIFAVISWVVFGIIILIRNLRGMPPRNTALASIVGIICVVITYIGVAIFIKG